MKFTEKSSTLPGQAYAPAELIQRSKNGTMPPIYHEGLSYDFEDVNENGVSLTYSDQESVDVDPIDSYPQLEDLLYMRDQLRSAQETLSKLAKIRQHLKNQKDKKQPSVANDNLSGQITALQEALEAVAGSAKNEHSGDRSEADKPKK